MSMFTTTDNVHGITPDAYGPLVLDVVQQKSVALQVTTVLSTNSTNMLIPVETGDASAAWTAEGAEITTSDVPMDELKATPKKLAGLTIVSNELANDSSPAAAQIVGNSLARNIAAKLDAAFFGTTTTNGPAGLGSLTGVSAVAVTTAFANLDPFAEAMSDVEQEGTRITAFVANPADALVLAQLKDRTDSNKPLLGMDPTRPGARQIFGVPLYVSPHLAANTVYGIAAERTFTVLRQGVTVDMSRDAKFTSDQTAIRAVLRADFAYPAPASVAKITVA